MFGFLRFLTGLGVGMIVATGGAVIAEFAPANRRNLFNAIVHSGVPAGGVMASIFALLLNDVIGWRGLFPIDVSPLLFPLPLAWFALPESPRRPRPPRPAGGAVRRRTGLIPPSPAQAEIIAAQAPVTRQEEPALN